MKHFFLLPLFFLCGCSTALSPFGIEDRRLSMLPHLEKTLASVSSIADSQNEYPEIEAKIPSFLLLHNAIIVAAKDFEASGFYTDGESTVAEQDGKSVTTMTWSFGYDENGKGASNGQAALISNDGYFLTAAHAIDSKDIRLLFQTLDLETNEARMRQTPIRKVLVDKKADFAIIKADLESPFHLRLRETPIQLGESIYCGAWINEGAIHGLVRTIEPGKSKIAGEYSRITSSAPTMRGDSGSAVIDEKGQLVAITVGVGFGRESYSIFVMPSVERIRKAIEDDRKDNQGSEN